MDVQANFGLVVKFRLKELKEMYEGGKQMSAFLKPGQLPLLMKIDGESGDSLEFVLHEDDLKIGKEIGEYKLLDADPPFIEYGDSLDKEKGENNGNISNSNQPEGSMEQHSCEGLQEKPRN